ncbi:MAG: HlyD family efflux transporter periplasmic adaptor subunit [Oceanospirillaceae bacterium]|nr:HlyD family efflux transporter periplasmic adaptor subunit [Oceanospirillaceae bacterium]
MSLPALRQELALYKGPRSLQGEPTWSLHDPVRNLYFRIDWPTFEILCRWHLSDPQQILQAIRDETVLDLDEDYVKAVIEFLYKRELTQRASTRDSQAMSNETNKRKQRWYVWLLHRYLFFRVPLWRPDPFLTDTLSWVRWLGSRGFALATLAALMVGLVQTIRQWDTFTATLVDMFSINGLIAYAVTLVSVKVLHELGHAYTAKRFGCRVPNMGVAFLVMFPMAYTDVNDVWQLKSRRQRLTVGAAGIMTELSIAAWSTLLWAILPDGALRTGVFLLATTTWISTVAINASPFLRFDGYFLLMDALELPNLHKRAFDLARWDLRKRLFGLGDAVPEYHSRKRSRFLKLFAWGTWIYRLVVFSGIAVLVYLMFPKPLGPLLAWVELYWFIFKPILGELKIWYERRSDIVRTRRSLLTLFVLLLFAGLVSIPWDSRIDAVAVLKPAEQYNLTLRSAARLESIVVESGTRVEQGVLLARFKNPDLEFERRQLETRLAGIERLLQNRSVNDELRERSQVLTSDAAKLRSEIDGINEKLVALEVRAPAAGTVYWEDLDLNSGSWLEERTTLGQIIVEDKPVVVAYVDQLNLSRIELGARGKLFFDSGVIAPLNVELSSIATDATRVLNDTMLGSVNGGEILARSRGDQVIPETAIYQLRLEPQDDYLGDLSILQGHLTLYGEPQAWITPYWRTALATYRREAGF